MHELLCICEDEAMIGSWNMNGLGEVSPHEVLPNMRESCPGSKECSHGGVAERPCSAKTTFVFDLHLPSMKVRDEDETFRMTMPQLHVCFACFLMARGGGGEVAAPAHMQPPPSGNLTLKLGITIPGSTLRIHHPAFRQSHPRPWRTTALACVPTCLLWTTVSYNDPSFPSF